MDCGAPDFFSARQPGRAIWSVHSLLRAAANKTLQDGLQFFAGPARDQDTAPARWAARGGVPLTLLTVQKLHKSPTRKIFWAKFERAGEKIVPFLSFFSAALQKKVQTDKNRGYRVFVVR